MTTPSAGTKPRVLSGMRPTGDSASRPSRRRADAVGRTTAIPPIAFLLNRRSARIHDRVRRSGENSRRAQRHGRGVARRRRRPEEVDDLSAVGRPGDQRAAHAALDDHAGVVARARADVQGTDRRARVRNRDVRFPRLSAAADCATSRSCADSTCRSDATRWRISSSDARSSAGSTISTATANRFSSKRSRRSRSFAEVPGTDGRKMSKSYDNTIYDRRRRRDDDEKSALDDHRSAESAARRSGTIRKFVRSSRCGISSTRPRSTASPPNAAAARSAASPTKPISPSSSTRISPDARTLRDVPSDPAQVERIIEEGTARTRAIAAGVLADVKRAMYLT